MRVQAGQRIITICSGATRTKVGKTMNVLVAKVLHTQTSTCVSVFTCMHLRIGQEARRSVARCPARLKTLALALISFSLLAFSGLPAFAASGCDGAGNCYVRAGATGAGSGADWTNAYTALPSSLTRGVTYYIAGGNYTSGHNFSDADSGSTPITIQAATIASHGTSTGWNNSYQAQAVFTCCWTFGTDYYIINGVYRSTASGNPTTDWTTGYGLS